MNTSPRNRYTQGEPLPFALLAVGRPVAVFIPGTKLIEAGQIACVYRSEEGGNLLYDVRVVSGATYKGLTLGDLNNPQPNTFTYAP